MTLHDFPALIQGTDEWYDQRRGMMTASVIGQMITPKTIQPAKNPASRKLTAVLVAERITGWTDANYQNDDMLRGHFDEPRAREKYAEHYGVPVAENGFLVRDDWGFQIGYSPDGLVADDGLIEVKSRRPKEHVQTVLADAVPPENMAQIQCGLLVSGRQWCDYLSYCGGMAMWRKRVTADQRWQDAIVQTVKQFEWDASVMVTAYHAATKGLPQTERVTELEMSL